MPVSQAVIADGHAETAIGRRACSRTSQFGWIVQRWVVQKRLPYLACHPILIGAKISGHSGCRATSGPCSGKPDRERLMCRAQRVQSASARLR
jgi:hypothetical protein